MSKLLMLRGLPASGKSTFAENLMKTGEYYRVNRDLLRTMLHCDKFNSKNEIMTIETQRLIVGTLLADGKNVIVDDTNLGEKHLVAWQRVAETFGAAFEMQVIDTPFKTCIERNKNRDKKVPESVIRNMALQYGMFNLKKIVVVDIDGTVADCTHRQHHVNGEGKKDWKSFFSTMDEDTPRTDVYQKAMDEAIHAGAEIIFVSARPEDYRDVTEAWLKKHDMDYIALVMRGRGDSRPDTQVKRDIHEKYLKQYEIVKVFDDRPVVIEMWRGLGLTVEDVGNGIDF